MTALLAGARTRRGRAYKLAVAGGFALIALLVGVAIWKLVTTGAFNSRRWQPFTVWVNWRFLLTGYLTNLRAGLVAGLLSIVVGVLLALGRLSRSPAIRWPATAWIETFRSLPLLYLILFSYLLIPRYAGINSPALYYGVFALTLYNSAVLGEIVRAGVLSLSRGQTEAAQSIGLSYWQTMGSVLLPQALRRMVPALVSQVITLLKDTSLLFVITVQELGRNGQALASRFNNPLQMYFMVGMIFLVVNLALSRLARRLEVRQRSRYGAGAIRVGGVEELTALEVQGEAKLKGAE